MNQGSRLQTLMRALTRWWHRVTRKQPDILIGLEVRESSWEDWLDSGGELYTKRGQPVKASSKNGSSR
ncbi:MAG TPA: hypothetical protein VGM81_14560 [Burkholderiaceae bacterium]|jgi:hypothetical protein